MPQSKVFRRSNASSEGNSSLPQVSRLLTFRVEISIISRDSNITDNIIQKVITMYNRKSARLKMEL